MSDVAYLIQISGVYDGWSIEVRADGTMRNRWANDDGTPREGCEYRWAVTEEYMKGMEK